MSPNPSPMTYPLLTLIEEDENEWNLDGAKRAIVASFISAAHNFVDEGLTLLSIDPKAVGNWVTSLKDKAAADAPDVMRQRKKDERGILCIASQRDGARG